MNAYRGAQAKGANFGVGGRLVQAASFLIHIAVDASQSAPAFLGLPRKAYSRGLDGIWRDENRTQYFGTNDGDDLYKVDGDNWLDFQSCESLLYNPEQFLPCQFDEFHPCHVKCHANECQINLFSVDESEWQAYYHEDHELVKTTPTSVRQAVLKKLSTIRTPAEEALSRLHSEIAYLQNSLHDCDPINFAASDYIQNDFPSRRVRFGDSLMDQSSVPPTEVFPTELLPSVPEDAEMHDDTDSSEGDPPTLRSVIPGGAVSKRSKTSPHRLADGLIKEEDQAQNDEPPDEDEDQQAITKRPRVDYKPNAQEMRYQVSP